MTRPQHQELMAQAEQLIDQGACDAAIDLLRVPASNQDAPLSALLARAYHLRGDTKGDIYASHFFAQRALELGAVSNELLAIQAIGAFRKEAYAEAAALFGRYVTPDAPPPSRLAIGLACLYAGEMEPAVDWLGPLAATLPDRLDIANALACAREGRLPDGPPSAQEIDVTTLGGLYDERPQGVDSPYALSAVSKLAGIAVAPKDFHWLEKNIPCQAACPAHTDIPEYLTAIHQGDYDYAYQVNLQDNVFPGVLGRVCARPCETECRHGWPGLGDSVAICFSKRSAADFAATGEPVLLDPYFDEPTGKRVAVVGAGVAGLAAARELARCGHTVTVYEKHHRPGGMLNQGIPVFRLPRESIEREIEQVRRQGVEILCNRQIGKDLSLAQLKAEHDAVILAAGTLRPNVLDLPGRELDGVMHGLAYLLQVNDTNDGPAGRKVVIIGGGFTAMDCARAAARLGSKLTLFESSDTDWRAASMQSSASHVRVLYRRSVDEMLVTPGELEELEHEAIGIDFLMSPIAYLGENGKVRAVRFIRNELGEPDADGRRRPIPVPGSEFDVEADLVLLATGQFPDTSWIDDELKPALVGDDQWMLTSGDVLTDDPRIFLAGDFSTGAKSLIDAIGHGKHCARAVDAVLMERLRLRDVAFIEDVTDSGRIREMDAVPLQPMPTQPPADRTLTSEVEQGFTPTLAEEETQRCYRCHLKYEIDSDTCIYCDWCWKAKPRPDCIVKARRLIYSDEGEIVGFERADGSEDKYLIYINQEDCIRCGACVDACPADCISIQKVSLAVEPLDDGH